MSTRVISDRELLHNLAFEVAELRRGLAAAIERLEALEAPLELDADRHSRRVAPPARYCRACGVVRPASWRDDYVACPVHGEVFGVGVGALLTLTADYGDEHSSRSLGRLHDYLELTSRPSSVGS